MPHPCLRSYDRFSLHLEEIKLLTLAYKSLHDSAQADFTDFILHLFPLCSLHCSHTDLLLCLEYAKIISSWSLLCHLFSLDALPPDIFQADISSLFRTHPLFVAEIFTEHPFAHFLSYTIIIPLFCFIFFVALTTLWNYFIVSYYFWLHSLEYKTYMS